MSGFDLATLIPSLFEVKRPKPIRLRPILMTSVMSIVRKRREFHPLLGET
jgi:hypothetical protein